MSLKINYLDNKKGSIKNKAIFVHLDAKISEITGDLDLFRSVSIHLV